MPVGVACVEALDGSVDRGFKLRVHKQREADAREDGRGELKVGAVDGGESVAAGIDEEALEADDSGTGERLELMLIAVDAATPERVVDGALRRSVRAAGGGGFALESECAF